MALIMNFGVLCGIWPFLCRKVRENLQERGDLLEETQYFRMVITYSHLFNL